MTNGLRKQAVEIHGTGEFAGFNLKEPRRLSEEEREVLEVELA
jgi:hypothetical protein